MNNTVDCLKCKYYYVTWDPMHPKGCRFFGFKSMIFPSLMVKRASGEICKGFSPKASHDNQPLR
ncbi:MAG: uracil-DNA glycosylase [Clostridiaceae bacterium]|nr:uracil-DNA glycosylase [Clostridiaceae bacterium]